MKIVDLKVVVGANFGDEGKGLVTDALCRQIKNLSPNETIINVLSNGGAQRGHTVKESYLNGGRRHVFHHFGSGTMAGAITYMSADFIVNPLIFVKELDELKEMGINPIGYINETARLSTPYDMILNQLLEFLREEKHGSCGCGIYETILRSDRQHHLLDVAWWFSYLDTRDITEDIRDKLLDHMFTRLHEEGYTIDDIPQETKDIIFSNNLWENFLSDLQIMKKWVNKNSQLFREAINSPTIHLVVENAQGLLLDTDIDEVHSTPTNTGFKEIIRLCEKDLIFHQLFREIKFCIEVYYVSRTYLTRHGDGPFDDMTDSEYFRNIKDFTNIPNEYQGSIRYSLLDYDELLDRMYKDISSSDIVTFISGYKKYMRQILVFTHVNEMDMYMIPIISKGEKVHHLNNFSHEYISRNDYSMETK